jgi:hypothetical protein
MEKETEEAIKTLIVDAIKEANAPVPRRKKRHKKKKRLRKLLKKLLT